MLYLVWCLYKLNLDMELKSSVLKKRTHFVYLIENCKPDFVYHNSNFLKEFCNITLSYSALEFKEYFLKFRHLSPILLFQCKYDRTDIKGQCNYHSNSSSESSACLLVNQSSS